MKPLTIVLIAVAVVLLIGITIFFVATRGTNSGGLGNGSSGGTQEATASASQALPNAPTSTLLAIGTSNGTVNVNNFYLSDPEVTDGGETVILASTTEYLITYDTTDSSFWIGIAPDQFSAARPSAEQTLVSLLGVSSADICKLNVVVGTFYSATSTLAGQSFPLSFCPAASAPQ